MESNHLYEVKTVKELTEISETPLIKTYEDHRMAMAFAPLAMLMNVDIEEPGVVAKSYPEFWEHLGQIVTYA